jgi:hypothetical protein
MLEEEGTQEHLSPELVQGIWIWRILCTVVGSNKSHRRSSFQTLTPGRKRSTTKHSRSFSRFLFGLGLKEGMEGIQGEFQNCKFSPLVIDQQAPNSTTFCFSSNLSKSKKIED